MDHWVTQQVSFLRALRGQTVVAWRGVEMALRDAGPDGLPQWLDESVPALQLERLDLIQFGGAVASVVTYQNDDRWGLCRLDDLLPSMLPSDQPESIFRVRTLGELPVGQVEDVAVVVDEAGDIAEVRLRITGQEVALRAGEVYEQPDGSLRVVTMDESVLVQVDGKRPNPALQQTAPAYSFL